MVVLGMENSLRNQYGRIVQIRQAQVNRLFRQDLGQKLPTMGIVAGFAYL